MVAFKIRSCKCIAAVGLLAQSAERGADNAKVVNSTPTRTAKMYFWCCCFLQWFKNILKLIFFSFFLQQTSQGKPLDIRALSESSTRAGYPVLTSLIFLFTFRSVFFVWTENLVSLSLFICCKYSHNFGIIINASRGIILNGRAPV